MWKLSLALAAFAAFAQQPRYGAGRPPTAEELKSMDISVLHDGRGLPPGSGTAAKGKDVYFRRCSKCHGGEGQGKEEGAPLVGGKGSLATAKPLKTVGSFWPYATTLFDYVRRAMPFDRPGTLTDEQVYSAVAHVLFLNGLIGENEVIDAQSLPAVKMPNRDGFIKDPRPKIK